MLLSNKKKTECWRSINRIEIWLVVLSFIEITRVVLMQNGQAKYQRYWNCVVLCCLLAMRSVFMSLPKQILLRLITLSIELYRWMEERPNFIPTVVITFGTHSIVRYYWNDIPTREKLADILWNWQMTCQFEKKVEKKAQRSIEKTKWKPNSLHNNEI